MQRALRVARIRCPRCRQTDRERRKCDGRERQLRLLRPSPNRRKAGTALSRSSVLRDRRGSPRLSLGPRLRRLLSPRQLRPGPHSRQPSRSLPPLRHYASGRCLEPTPACTPHIAPGIREASMRDEAQAAATSRTSGRDDPAFDEILMGTTTTATLSAWLRLGVGADSPSLSPSTSRPRFSLAGAVPGSVTISSFAAGVVTCSRRSGYQACRSSRSGSGAGGFSAAPSVGTGRSLRR